MRKVLSAAERERGTGSLRGIFHLPRRGFPPSSDENNPRDGRESRGSGGRIPCGLYRDRDEVFHKCLGAHGQGEHLSASAAEYPASPLLRRDWRACANPANQE